MISEISTGQRIVVTDVGQTLADGGIHYFRKHRGNYDPNNPSTLVPVYNDFSPLPNAQNGLQRLIEQFKFGGYYTVRPPELGQQVTDWLSKYRFPSPDNIRISTSPRQKLEQIAEDFFSRQDIPQSVILIDDNLEQLTKAAKRLVFDQPEMKNIVSHIVVVGYGAKNRGHDGGVHLPTGLRIFTLASWEEQNTSNLLNSLNLLYSSE